MTKFVCTRGASVEQNEALAVSQPVLAPKDLPKVDYADLCEKGYAERAEVILGAFFGLKINCSVYSEFDDDPATVVKLDDNMFVAELWHGGTRSAIDIPLCVLPEIIRAAKHDGLTECVSDNNSEVPSCGKSDLTTIAALTVCFYSAYCDLVNNGEITGGNEVDFVIPESSGEYIVAGWYARRMGLPVNRLLCACGADGALYDFIDLGVFDTNRDGVTDSKLADNIERLIFDVSGGNSDLTRGRVAELTDTGRFSVSPDEIEHIRDIISVDYVGEDIASEAIYDLFDEYGYVADPATAIAYAVAAEREFVHPTVVLSISDPFWSAQAIMRALGALDDNLLDRMEELTAMDCAEYVRSKI